MTAGSEQTNTSQGEKPTQPSGSRAPAGEAGTADTSTKTTHPKSPREFIQERMRELDKKES